MLQKKIRIHLYFLLVVLAAIITACSNKSNSNSDLSFAGITIGQAFPDSLKDKFKPYTYPGPSYEGSVPFIFPGNKKKNLSLDVNCNMEGTEVICISVNLFNLDEAIDMFNMLKARYGKFMSDYVDSECGLQYLMGEVYKSIGYDGWNDVDISGDRIIASWSPAGFRSDILFIAHTWQSSTYGSTPTTHYTLRYVDKSELEKAFRQRENKHDQEERDSYRKANKESMNQDF